MRLYGRALQRDGQTKWWNVMVFHRANQNVPWGLQTVWLYWACFSVSTSPRVEFLSPIPSFKLTNQSLLSKVSRLGAPRHNRLMNSQPCGALFLFPCHIKESFENNGIQSVKSNFVRSACGVSGWLGRFKEDLWRLFVELCPGRVCSLYIFFYNAAPQPRISTTKSGRSGSILTSETQETTIYRYSMFILNCMTNSMIYRRSIVCFHVTSSKFISEAIHPTKLKPGYILQFHEFSLRE